MDDKRKLLTDNQFFSDLFENNNLQIDNIQDLMSGDTYVKVKNRIDLNVSSLKSWFLKDVKSLNIDNASRNKGETQ